jgi:hypothetical protein
MSEKPSYIEIVASELNLCLTNFRFLNSVHNEQEAILEMLRLKKVGPAKIKNLITDIIENNLIFEDFIVFQEEGKYIVYDGNRRLSAIKLFLEENLNMIQNEFNNLYNFIKDLKNKNIDLSKMVVTAKLYNDKKLMLNHIKLIHSGEQDGIGQISWGNIEKGNFNKLQSNNKPTFTNRLLSKLHSSPNHKALHQKILEKQISTTVDRIFGFYVIKSRIFGLKRGEDISLKDNLNIDKICEMIEYFIENNGTVSDVYLKDNADNFFKTIQPINQVSNNHNTVEQLSFEELPDLKVKTNTTNNNDFDESKITIIGSKNSNKDLNDEKKIILSNKNNSNNEDPEELPNEQPKNITRLTKPETNKYLTSAYKINNKYKENPRINTIKRELNNLEYKSFTVSAMFLIRALLEAYTHAYIDFFANLPYDSRLKMKNIAKDRSKRNKSLQDLLFTDIYNHLKNVLDKYPETYELINATLSNNNNTALTQIINYHIHSGIDFPDKGEVLNAWSKAHSIINTLDEILYDYKISGHIES